MNIRGLIKGSEKAKAAGKKAAETRRRNKELRQKLNKKDEAKRLSELNENKGKNATQLAKKYRYISRYFFDFVLKRKEKTFDKSFDNYFGTKKTEAREIMCEAIKESGVNRGVILSLSAALCLFEIAVTKTVSKFFSFCIVEKKKDVFLRMIESATKEGIKIRAAYNGMMSDVIERARENDYSHLCLDYCGSFFTFKREISVALKNNIVVKNGLICATFCKRTGRADVDVKNKGMLTENGIKELLKSFPNYKIIKTYPYSENAKEVGKKKTSPMILVIIKRCK